MPETPTPGSRAYEAYRTWYSTADPTSAAIWPDHAALRPDDRAAWEAAAQAVRAPIWPQAPALLYVVVLQHGYQIQLCGAYPNADEAGIHLAHARTIMPEQHFEIRVCPFALTGQTHRQETPHS